MSHLNIASHIYQHSFYSELLTIIRIIVKVGLTGLLLYIFVEQKKLSNDYIIYEIVYLLYLAVSDHSQGFKAFIFDTVAVVVLQICICS